jgi:hypothetical protein
MHLSEKLKQLLIDVAEAWAKDYYKVDSASCTIDEGSSAGGNGLSWLMEAKLPDQRVFQLEIWIHHNLTIYVEEYQEPPDFPGLETGEIDLEIDPNTGVIRVTPRDSGTGDHAIPTDD